MQGGFLHQEQEDSNESQDVAGFETDSNAIISLPVEVPDLLPLYELVFRSYAKPQKLTQELADDAALLVTMRCGDNCPYVCGLRRDQWSLRDPKGLPIEEVRTIRDAVKERVWNLVAAESL